MAVAPVELQHVTFPRTLFGYRRGAVEDLLHEVAQSYEDVWREREDLRDRVHQLEQELKRQRELESLLRETLVSAERAAQEVKENARTEAELVVREAHGHARAITHDALAERERLAGEATRIRALLANALTGVEQAREEAEDRPAKAA